MYHYYQLPIFSFSGCSDSKTFDQQASAEGALWMIITALGGGNLIHDVGYIESGMTASYEQLVCMNEIASLVKRFMQGVEVVPETIALDVIAEVGPGGEFLSHEHTYQYFRQNWIPELFNRSSNEEWKTEGSLTLGEVASAKVRHILETHEPQPINKETIGALNTVIKKAEKGLK
jgi:trimethylamine--corrinoid protein Co-methyltransferase